MHDAPFLTCLCIAPGTKKELSALVAEFRRQDYAPSLRELVIIDDGLVNQQPVLAELLSSFEEEISVRYHHSPQRLLAEEKVRLGVELAQGEWFHFMTVNTYYPEDYFCRAVSQVQSSAEKIIGLARETLWLSPLKRFCYRGTRLSWYSALNTLCCHRSVIESSAFLLSANGWEASLTRAFTEVVEVNPPVTYCHDIMAIIQKGLLLNTTPTASSPPDVLMNEPQPEKFISWHFFHKIACINLNEDTTQAQSLRSQLEVLQAPLQKTLWFSAHKGHSPVAGRMQAWLEVFHTAQNNRWENVLILEDDVQFVRQDSMVEKVNALLASLAARTWKVVLFSAQYQDVHLLTEMQDTVTVHNAAAIGACAVHSSYFATLINFFEQLVNKAMSAQNPQEVHPDYFWHILMKNDPWLGLWPSWGFLAPAFHATQSSIADTVPLFFRPLLVIDNDTRRQVEGPLLERVKCFQATPQIYIALAELNHEMQRYELAEYYRFKASGRLPKVTKDERCPLLSVIITAYNQVGHLKETFESICRQSYPNLEIVVADDYSSDSTQHYMETIADSRLCYVRNSTNLGPLGNFEAACKKHLRGEYILFIDHDDFFINRHYLWNAVLCLENDKNLSVVFSDYYDWYEHNNAITPSHSVSGISTTNGKQYFLEYGFKLRNLQPLVTVCRKSSLIQAQSLKLDPDSKVGDLHIYTRIMLLGNVKFIPAFSAVYRRHAESLTFNHSNDNDIRSDIAFMKNLEETRILALQQGMDRNEIQNWFNKISINHFAGWRLVIIINKKQYPTALSLLAWMNKYYPEIGRAVLAHLLVRK